jgi:hypothetical protein
MAATTTATTETPIRIVPKASTRGSLARSGGVRVAPGLLTLARMWKRLRRRSFAPSRPALFPDQVGLLAITLVAMAVGIYVVARFLL